MNLFDTDHLSTTHGTYLEMSDLDKAMFWIRIAREDLLNLNTEKADSSIQIAQSYIQKVKSW